MIRRLALFTLGPMMLVSPQQAASSDASRFCVKPITIERVHASKPYSQSQGPSRLKFAFEASTPFPVDNVKDPPHADRYYMREVFWHIQPDYRLVGPIHIPERLVLGTDSRFVYLREKTSGIGGDGNALNEPREDRIWSLAPDGKMELVDGPWTDAKWQVSLESGQSGMGKLILIGWPREPGSSNRQNYFALKNRRVEHWGEDRPFIPSKSFPDSDLAVRGERRGLSLKFHSAPEIQQLSLPHTSDHGEWESLNIDRYGWLFAEGNGNDYAIELDLEEDQSFGRVHRFTGRGWFGRLVEWIFGSGPETDIAATQWSSQCVDYSPVLRLTLFCDPAKVLRKGVLQDFPHGSAELDRYIGDASGLEVALIKGHKNELYAFDGDALQMVSDSLGSFIKAHDVPEAKRTFVTGGNGAYELTGSFPNLALVKLADRPNRTQDTLADQPNRTQDTDDTDFMNEAFRRMTFMSAPNSDAVLGINQNSIWHLGERSNQMIWRNSNVRILTSEVAPVAIWNGLLFLTVGGQANLIEQCST